MKKIMYLLMAIAILGLLFVSGCSTIGLKDKCIASGGEWRPATIGIGGGSSEGQCACTSGNLIEGCRDDGICTSEGKCTKSYA